jgi:hypothetical protein
MAFIKSLLIASVAAVAFAAPQGGSSDKNAKVDIDSETGEAKCGNGQKLACCNTGEDLIGLNCLSVPIRTSSCNHLHHHSIEEASWLTFLEQSPFPSNRPAVPTSPPAARLAMPRATSSTLRPTALPFLFKRFLSSLRSPTMTAPLL